MSYTLTKSIPILVEDKLLKKIAKINNLDHKTGIPLPELPKEPSQFQLLCLDMKEGFFSFLRHYILSIIIVVMIGTFLYYRYLKVKEYKIQKELERIENEKIIKEQLRKKIEKEEIDTILINQQIEQEEKQKLYMDNIRNKFNNFDDTNNKNKFFSQTNYQNNYQNYATF
jgi:hypothetical protein